ncbi:MAG: aspartate kinase [Candidatus Saccharibacteria bacterium]
MSIIVQKYGGTSVATAEQRELVCRNILEEKRRGKDVVVVVSAMGREQDPYATDTLIDLARKEFPSPSRRDLDLLMSCGEIISGVVVSSRLQAYGENSVVLTGMQAGIVTNSTHGDARIIRVDPTMIKRSLDEGYTVIIAGFQGITEEGQITTLGRGGSDVTASAIGVALGAEVIDIYTDVEGIMTADPRIVQNARLLNAVTYNEICQLAREGAKVIHPRAVEIAMEGNIPLRIRSTFTNGPGTLVGNLNRFGSSPVPIKKDHIITGITQMPDIAQIRITSRGDYDLALKVFKSMALAEISVDFISVNPEVIMFTVREENSLRAEEILRNIGLEPELIHNCAKVAAVGAAMTGVPGVMATVVEALNDADVELLQTGDSYTNIWCLVRREHMEKAVKALHDKFELGN